MAADHPKQEKTFCMVKPDGVKRGIIGDIINRFEQRGLKVVALRMEMPSKEKVDGHYPKDEAWVTRLGEKTLKTYAKAGWDPMAELGTDKAEEIGPMVREWLITFMHSAPVVKMVVQGVRSVDMVRKIVGSTMPADADMGTIRGDYSVDSPLAANKEKRSVHNLIHASETPEEALHEIAHWFTEDELCEYSRSEEEMQF
ncbi:nucleoside-diphosphate kinase [Patescibacteria group bacterium]|nr:nucleoside-diphosphate kinase [Patescibacteria group bacterium]MBU1906860.1 nucleoside-diphosphate kinase [Patescibacteria group bacterium]